MEVSIQRIHISNPEVSEAMYPRIREDNEGSFKLLVDDLGNIHKEGSLIERPLLTIIQVNLSVKAVAQTARGEHTDLAIEVIPLQTPSLLEKYD